MKKPSTPETAGCPTGEQLSAFVDGENDHAVQAHIRECPDCARRVKAYRRIDKAVQSLIAPPESLVDRITKACCAQPGPETAQVFWFPRVFAVAAAMAVLAGAAFVLFHPGPGRPSRVAAFRSPKAPATHKPGDAVVLYQSSQVTPLSTQYVARSAANISPNQVRAAGLSGRGLRSAVPRIAIPGRVRHVWVVNDAGAMGRLLQTTLPKGARCLPVENAAGASRYRVRIMDDQLPALVDQLAGAGSALVSPMAPQPSNRFHGRQVVWLVRHRPVDYDVSFVTQQP